MMGFKVAALATLITLPSSFRKQWWDLKFFYELLPAGDKRVLENNDGI